jgi:hypothetical protein
MRAHTNYQPIVEEEIQYDFTIPTALLQYPEEPFQKIIKFHTRRDSYNCRPGFLLKHPLEPRNLFGQQRQRAIF